MLRQRRILFRDQPAGRTQHFASLWHGDPHLRDADRLGRIEPGTERSRGGRRRRLAQRTQLETGFGENARSRRRNLVRRDDDLRAAGEVWFASVQRDFAIPEVDLDRLRSSVTIPSSCLYPYVGLYSLA